MNRTKAEAKRGEDSDNHEEELKPKTPTDDTEVEQPEHTKQDL